MIRMPEPTTRREILKAAAAAGTLASLPQTYARAARRETLRVGLVGCGGRGTGAATQALSADPDVKLVSMADAFEDRLQESLSFLQGEPQVGARVDVPP